MMGPSLRMLSVALSALCRPRTWATMGGLLLVISSRVMAGHLPSAVPESVGMSAPRLAVIDSIVGEGLRRGEMPGAVVLVGRRGRIVFLKAYGNRQLQPQSVPMTVDTLFDMASITKPVATATSVMQLVEQGRVELSKPVADYLPEFAANGKESVTVYQLLTHQGGLIPDNALRDYQSGLQQAWQRIYALGLRAAPGERFMYTDVGFIVLAELVRRVSGHDIHQYSRKHIFGALGMTETGYLPPDSLKLRAAATEQRDGHWLVGEVHDPRAHLLGGVAGHAGLFSTARDLAVYAQMMLNGGAYAGRRVLRPETVTQMTRGYHVPGGLRGLGWDVRTGYSSNRGDLLSSRAFGHGGFTGTVLWIDPGQELFVVFLSTRLHPDGKGTVNRLAGRIATIAASSISAGSPVADALPAQPVTPVRQVLTGIDVLRRDGCRILKGRRVGLITNHTGVDRTGRSTIRILTDDKQCKLVALFSPEHGIAGRLDVPQIGDSTDKGTGLRIISLYGQNRQPTANQLEAIDVLVFDIQDIGTRFYTYVSTMGLAMQAAAEHGKSFVVLDRPNPINGRDVQGPVLDAGRESFVGFHPIAVRHGMTTGELAMMFKSELKLKLDLHVIRCQGWRRSDMFDATGLGWIDPSPNMRSLTQALLYPGVGLLETTNLSVGRGTDTPFERVGAPWIDGRQLAGVLNRSGLAGVRFIPITFTPDASKFRGERCEGVSLVITRRAEFHPLRTGLSMARALRRGYAEQWKTDNLMRLLANAVTHKAVLAGKHVDEIELLTQAELDRFRHRRARFLLYD
ncbi:MAG: exo-beta-N-acetylmuramidase NamZ domain-containing protein [Planctomycetaceae bacterium]